MSESPPRISIKFRYSYPLHLRSFICCRSSSHSSYVNVSFHLRLIFFRFSRFPFSRNQASPSRFVSLSNHSFQRDLQISTYFWRKIHFVTWNSSFFISIDIYSTFDDNFNLKTAIKKILYLSKNVI